MANEHRKVSFIAQSTLESILDMDDLQPNTNKADTKNLTRFETKPELYDACGLSPARANSRAHKHGEEVDAASPKLSTTKPDQGNSVKPRASIVRPKSLDMDSEDFEVLVTGVFDQLVLEDPKYRDRALEGYLEFLTQGPERAAVVEEGIVNRRAPMNPFSKKKTEVINDPALRNNPLRGRLICLFTTSAALLFVFLQALVLNSTYTGKAHVPFKENGMIGPSGLVLYELGGLNTNSIRDGDIYRIFWASWMHSGWLHIIFNVLSQMQFFFMYEPDWGFWRSFLVFWIAEISGNLLSAALDPCKTTVGSSGGLFGLMGAMIPYCIEYWKTIPRPGMILLFTLLILIISVIIGFTGNTDNWAHTGGLLGGTLFAFGTITRLSAIEDFYRTKERGKRQETLQAISIDSARFFGKNDANTTVLILDEIENADSIEKKLSHQRTIKTFHGSKKLRKVVRPECSFGKSEWTVRITSFIILIAGWITLFILILVSYDSYGAVGHVSFTNSDKCVCCFMNMEASTTPKKDGIPYYCFPSHVLLQGWTVNFGDFCKMTLEEIEKDTHKKPRVDAIGRKL